MRASRSVKIFFEGELCAEMSSVGSTVDLLMLYDPNEKKYSYSAVKTKLGKACKYGDKLFGFTFEKDVNWKASRPVRETNVLTGETFITDSVNHMGTRVFGGADSYNAMKRSKLCRSGREHLGFVYEYVNEDYYVCAGSKMSGVRRPVLQIKGGVTQNSFKSLTEAAYHILGTGESGTDSVLAIRNRISASANGARDFKTYLGYTWVLV